MHMYTQTHADMNKHMETNLDSHVCAQKHLHTRTHTQHKHFPPHPHAFCLSAPTRLDMLPLGSQSTCSESFPYNLPRFRAGYLDATDNSTGSRQEKVGFDRERVQMVAVSPRCCMETNKSAEIGSSAAARPC